MAKLLLLLLCCIPAILAQCNLERAQSLLKRSAYEFAIGLSTRIAQENDNHFVASTLSSWALLAGASLGAAGTTLAEFRKVLHLHYQPCFNDRYFEMIGSVTAESADVVFGRSSTVFVDRSLDIGAEFRRRINVTGIGSVVPLPFDNPDNVAAAINDYVSRATHDTIVDIVVSSDLDGIYLIMVDAVYFKGAWQTPFSAKNTAVAPFFNERGMQIGEASLMVLTGLFNFSPANLIHADVLELPYGADGRYVMLLFLPHPDTTLFTVIEALKRVSLTTIYALFSQNDMQTVHVTLPRFDVFSDLNNLKELLGDMGLRSAFDSQSAEFPYISSVPLFIANFVQKANIKVSEEGTVASAATAALFASRSSPERFLANKPFFYMIVDTKTQVPIFTGAYSKPSVQ